MLECNKTKMFFVFLMLITIAESEVHNFATDGPPPHLGFSIKRVCDRDIPTLSKAIWKCVQPIPHELFDLVTGCLKMKVRDESDTQELLQRVCRHRDPEKQVKLIRDCVEIKLASDKEFMELALKHSDKLFDAYFCLEEAVPKAFHSHEDGE